MVRMSNWTLNKKMTLIDKVKSKLLISTYDAINENPTAIPDSLPAPLNQPKKEQTHCIVIIMNTI